MTRLDILHTWDYSLQERSDTAAGSFWWTLTVLLYVVVRLRNRPVGSTAVNILNSQVLPFPPSWSFFLDTTTVARVHVVLLLGIFSLTPSTCSTSHHPPAYHVVMIFFFLPIFTRSVHPAHLLPLYSISQHDIVSCPLSPRTSVALSSWIPIIREGDSPVGVCIARGNGGDIVSP